jgi:polycomb protein EED
MVFDAKRDANSQAFHANPLYMLSGGMDHAVCLWTLPILHQPNPRNPAPPNAIAPTTDLPERYSYPHVSTTAIHSDYVDCVEFHNDFILSKSSREGKIVLWQIHGFDSQRKFESISKPPTTHEWKETRTAFGESVERLMQFDIRHCEPWFMKFGLFSSPFDPSRPPQHITGPGLGTFLAMGNLNSNVYVWDLSVYENTNNTKGEQPGRTLTDPFTLLKPQVTLSVPKLKRAIRMMAWSVTGEWLVGVGDMGLVCLWQVGKNE